MDKKKWLIALAAGAGAAAVTYSLLSDNIPEGAVAVEPFDMNRYLGKWYEVARLPNRIEKNLSPVIEEYALAADGSFDVLTRGYNVEKKDWVNASGKIKYAGATNSGLLKVSYLRPIYFSYNVLDLDADYQYALVSGSSLNYLWILSRQTTIPDDIRIQFLLTASVIGFDIDKLEWPDLTVELP